LGQNAVGLIFRSRGRVVISGVTTETTLLDVPTGIIIPANKFKIAETYRMTILGQYDNTGTGGTVKVKLNGTLLVNQAVGAFPNLTGQVFKIEFDLYVVSIGATADIGCIGSMTYGNGNNLPSRTLMMTSGVAATSINTTVSQTLDITITPASAAGGNSWNVLSSTLEKLDTD